MFHPSFSSDDAIILCPRIQVADVTILARPQRPASTKATRGRSAKCAGRSANQRRARLWAAPKTAIFDEVNGLKVDDDNNNGRTLAVVAQLWSLHSIVSGQ